MRIAITGASGLIGRALIGTLGCAGHELLILSRRAGVNAPSGVRVAAWDPERGEPPAEALREIDAVVHLAGENVAQRWTQEAKRRIRESRVAGTRRLVEALRALPHRPAALVCASAVGYYGSRGDEELTEDSSPGSDFLAEVCAAWEREARAAEELGMRVARLRIGIVLDPRGGALARMLTPFRLGAGGPLGDGRQWMSWIHAADVAALLRFAVENPLDGAINAVSPNPVRNAVFARELGRALGRPALIRTPGVALKMLFGEMAEALLGSQRVTPRNALAAGFQFQFPEIGPALAQLLAESR